MSTDNSFTSTPEEPAFNLPRVIARVLIVMLIPLVILFAAAGRLDWVAGWAFVLTTVGFTLFTRLTVLLRHPELARERARGFSDREGVQSWDRRIAPWAALYLPFMMLLVAGLDERYGWSPAVAGWLQVAALAVVLAGYLLAHWATIANRYFSAVVRIQKDRGHTVVTGGPYRYVRHPAYAGGIPAILAIPIVLGSLWALLPAAAAAALTVLRTAREDQMLRDELAGYVDYARQVRYRLLPGVW